MLPFSLRHEIGDGQTMEFVPEIMQPLGPEELTALSKQPDAVITLRFLAENPKINGNAVAGTAKVDQRMRFTEPMKIYALVPNGSWLPVPFVSPPRFLLDRNVVGNFQRLRSRQSFPDEAAYRLWTAFFEQGAGLFNPLPYAYEGSARRLQSFDEFVAEFEQGVREIAETFPRCAVVRYSASHYRAAYAQLLAMNEKTAPETEFICDICSLIVETTADSKLRSVTDQILSAADRFGVDRQSLAVLLALSCLFEDRHSGASIGRQILKPKKNYGPADAYNALSDLRHIELAALGHAWVANGSFALCTSDRAVASLWCALGIRDVVETATGPEFTIDYSSALFPRLTDDDAPKEIVALLNPMTAN
jgi:hypothetical protein